MGALMECRPGIVLQYIVCMYVVVWWSTEIIKQRESWLLPFCWLDSTRLDWPRSKWEIGNMIWVNCNKSVMLVKCAHS